MRYIFNPDYIVGTYFTIDILKSKYFKLIKESKLCMYAILFVESISFSSFDSLSKFLISLRAFSLSFNTRKFGKLRGTI